MTENNPKPLVLTSQEGAIQIITRQTEAYIARVFIDHCIQQFKELVALSL